MQNETRTLAARGAAASGRAARPLLIPPKHLQLAGAIEYRSVAVDGDTLLVGANRAINADNVTGVYIFQRAANGDWNYSGPLVEGLPNSSMVVLLQGNLAVVNHTTAIRVFERGAQGWTQTANIPRNPPFFANPFRIDDGAFYVRPDAGLQPFCNPPYQVFRKVGVGSGRWHRPSAESAARSTTST